mgnify:CR=1 FL=1
MRKYITSIIAALIALSCFHGQVLANYIDIKDQYGRTSLHIAAQAGDTNAVQALSQAGADINTRDEFGTTPLIEASRCGHDQIVRILIQAGADDQSPGKRSTKKVRLANLTNKNEEKIQRGRNPENPRRGKTGKQNDTEHLPGTQHHGANLLPVAQQIRRNGAEGSLENETA